MTEGLTFLTLCRLLETKKGICLELSEESNAVASARYNKARLYAEKELEESVLYVRESRDKETGRGELLEKNYHLATAPDCDVVELSNSTISVFEEIADWEQRMQQASWMPNAISEIIHVAGEQLPHPMYVADPGYKIFAMSDHPDMCAMSYSWNYAFNQGYLPMDTILNLSRSQELKEDKYANHAHITDSPNFYTRFTNYVIKENQTVHGHFFVIEISSKFESYEVELIQKVGDAIRLALTQNTQFNRTSGSLYEHFIVDVLEGTLKSTTLMLAQLAALGIADTETFAIVRIEPFGYDLSQLRSTCSIIEKKVRNTLAVLHRGGITAVIHAEDRIQENNLLLHMREFLEEADLRAGMSDFLHIGSRF